MLGGGVTGHGGAAFGVLQTVLLPEHGLSCQPVLPSALAPVPILGTLYTTTRHDTRAHKTTRHARAKRFSLLIRAVARHWQVAEWKAAHPGGGQYPKLAGLSYSRMHNLAALAGEEPKEMKRNRWYAWWVAFTADLGTPHRTRCTLKIAHAPPHTRTRRCSPVTMGCTQLQAWRDCTRLLRCRS
jgi:hypothetical protein